MKKKIVIPVKSICKCGKEYSTEEVRRIYGKESSPYILGYCSAYCYTQTTLKK